MRERRALRFAVEAVFLGALAAALALAGLSALAIGGGMLVGWLVVALYEWVATRELPHYGRGLPPRYYVPQVLLPPPRPLEQLRPTGYPSPEAVGDEPTWIASPAMRDEMLAEWPVAAGAPALDDTIVDDALFTAIAKELDEQSAPEAEPSPAGESAPEPAPELEPAPDPGTVAAEVEAVPAVEPVAAVVVVVPEPDPVAAEAPEDELEQVDEDEDGDEPLDGDAPSSEQPAVAVPAGPRQERHTFDPLAAEERRRRWRRRPDEEGGFAVVAALPPRPVGLPGHARREH